MIPEKWKLSPNLWNQINFISFIWRPHIWNFIIRFARRDFKIFTEALKSYRKRTHESVIRSINTFFLIKDKRAFNQKTFSVSSINRKVSTKGHHEREKLSLGGKNVVALTFLLNHFSNVYCQNFFFSTPLCGVIKAHIQALTCSSSSWLMLLTKEEWGVPTLINKHVFRWIFI